MIDRAWSASARRRASIGFSRVLLATVAALTVSGCGDKKAMPHAMSPASKSAAMTLMQQEGLSPEQRFNTEAYDRIIENAFVAVQQNPLSTFSIDVDTASYSNVRRFLREGQLPPKDAVRIEELINYFSYDYPQPEGDHPVSITTELAECPWKPAHRLLRIGLQTRRLEASQLPPRNFVFLIDVSGSMDEPTKLPLVQSSLSLLVDQLTERDRVGIVVYAGASGLVLPPTSGREKGRILEAINRLKAGGSTNGGEGIQLAYRLAEESLIPGGVNRVILATDGDFNVGITSQGELTRLIEEKRKTGVFLSVLGFGMGNLKDSTMEKLAHHGNGHYAYIDSLAEARKLFVEEGGALVTLAKDVKIQVEFNPRHVTAYRLIGYENRLLRHEEFKDDAKDAGDLGSGHSVTALYELVPLGVKIDLPGVDPLRYQEALKPTKRAESSEWLTLKLRYKDPDAETRSSPTSSPRSSPSKELVHPVLPIERQLAEASADFRFAAAVAVFGMVLRDSQHKGDASFATVLDLARNARGEDPLGYRAEFVKMVQEAESLARIQRAQARTTGQP